MPSANEFANLAGPKARQRFVIPVIFGISGADGRVVVQYAGLHDRERRRSRMIKSKIRRHCHMRGMRPLGFRQSSGFPLFYESLQTSLSSNAKLSALVPGLLESGFSG